MLLRDILQLLDSPFTESLSQTIAVIDQVHRFKPMAPFPIVITRKRVELDAYCYLAAPSRPEAIEISIHGSHPQLTLVHEIGHFLDHRTLNPIKRGFASEHDVLFDPLVDCWAANSLVCDLRKMMRRLGRYTEPSARTSMANRLSAPELWAPTYAQWVAIRSGDKLLLDQLERLRQRGSHFAGKWCSFHWDSVEFAGIINCVDDLMEKAGLYDLKAQK
jgi:hypothetical protein